MKLKSDPRHLARVKALKTLFAETFAPQTKEKSQLTQLVMKNLQSIDKLIETNAPAWPLSQISPADLAVLRLAIFELLFQKRKEPYKVVVDEAVELAKEFGSDSSGAFINGVLGTIIKSKQLTVKPTN